MHCYNCGEKVKDSAQKFCLNSGVALKDGVENANSKRKAFAIRSAPLSFTQTNCATDYSGKQRNTYQEAPTIKIPVFGKHSKKSSYSHLPPFY
jgi:hypothetical protein